MLEGRNVDLKLIEKEDIPQLLEMRNRPEFWGNYESPWQTTKADTEKIFDQQKGIKRFFIQKKDGTRVGTMSSWDVVPEERTEFGLEIGYLMQPIERGKGYCTEAVHLLLDYLFLTYPVVRIQAHTNVGNLASQRVLEKAGFKKEGTIRKGYYSRGKHTDGFTFSILKEEWNGPKMLKAAP